MRFSRRTISRGRLAWGRVALPHLDEARGHAADDRASGKALGHDGVRTNDAAVAESHAFQDRRFGPDPHIAPDRDRGYNHLLVVDGAIRRRKAVILIPERGIFADECVLTMRIERCMSMTVPGLTYTRAPIARSPRQSSSTSRRSAVSAPIVMAPVPWVKRATRRLIRTRRPSLRRGPTMARYHMARTR